MDKKQIIYIEGGVDLSLMETLLFMFPQIKINSNTTKSLSKLHIRELSDFFRNGVTIFGFHEFSKIIKNTSIINIDLNLKQFNKSVQDAYDLFIISNIEHLLFDEQPKNPIKSNNTKNSNFDKLYELFSNIIIFFMDSNGHINFEFNQIDKVNMCILNFCFNFIKPIDDQIVNLKLIANLFELFKSVNHDAIIFLIENYNNIEGFKNLTLQNIDKYKERVGFETYIYKINQAIDGISLDNYDVSINTLFDKQITSLFMDYGVYKVSQLDVLKSRDMILKLYNKININKLYDTLLDLNKSLIDEINDLSSLLIEKLNVREYLILLGRFFDKTLETLGLERGITRERVRQIENKAHIKLKSSIIGKKIMRTLLTLNNQENILRYDQLDAINDEYRWLIHILLNDYYNKKYKVYLFNQESENVINQFYTNLDDSYALEESEFIKLDELSKYLIKNNFYKVGKHYFRKKPGLLDKYRIVLEKYFEDGLHIHKAEYIKKFKRYYKYEFEDNDIENLNRHAFSSRIVAIKDLVQVDRGYYKLDRYKIPQTIIDKFKEDILQHGSLLISTLYSLNKNILNEVSIYNRYQVHSILKTYLDEFYITRDIVSVSEKQKKSSVEILDKYFSNNKNIIYIDDIKKDIPGITDIVIYTYISNRPDYLVLDNGKVVHQSELIFRSEDNKKILARIKDTIKEREFITSDTLYDEIIGVEFFHIIQENEINSKRFLYNFMQHFYKNDFQFTNYTIISKEDKHISIDDRIVDHFDKYNSITVDELFNYLDDNGIPSNNKKERMELLYKNGFIRIDEKRLVKKEMLKLPQHFIEEVETLILRNMIRGKINTKSIESYEYFPRISIRWNAHLLAHLLLNYSKKIKVYDKGITYLDIEYELEENEND